MCTFIWCANDIKPGPRLRELQDILIEDVFGYQDKREFVKKEKSATEVSTWDGRYRGFMSYKDLSTMTGWINIFGPLAGMYGRDIEQYLMRADRGPLILE